MSFELPEKSTFSWPHRMSYRSLLTSLGGKDRACGKDSSLTRAVPGAERRCQSPGLGSPRWERARENSPEWLPYQDRRESREGSWLLSLDSEMSLLNSLDFPSQPSRERVRLGNVSSEPVLLKPLGWVCFLQEPGKQCQRGINPSMPKKFSQGWGRPGARASGMQSLPGQEA